MKKRQIGPGLTFFPQPATLIGSVDAQGHSNLMCASWVGLVSKTPPTLAVSVHHQRATYDNITRQRAFVVNVMPARLAAETDLCGLTSGRETNKWAVTGLTPARGAVVEVPLVAEAPLNVECQLTGEVPLGDYRLLLGTIVEMHVAEDAFVADDRLDPRVLDPLVYLGGMRQYWNLGEEVGAAYRDGLRLLS